MESAQAEPSATTSIPSPAIIPASAPKIAPPPFPTTPVGPKIAASAPKPFPSTANVATATAQTMPDMGTPVPRVTVLPTTPGQAPKPAGPATPRPNPAHARANQTPQSAGRGRNDGSPRHHQRKPRRTSGDRNLSKEEDPLRVLVTGKLSPPFTRLAANTQGCFKVTRLPARLVRNVALDQNRILCRFIMIHTWTTTFTISSSVRTARVSRAGWRCA